MPQREPHDHVRALTSSPVPAYAAATWSFAFAALSVAWALGADIGVGTLAVAIRERVDDPGFRGVILGTAVLKAAAGVVALALVRPWRRWRHGRAAVALAWVAAAVLLFYGTARWVQAVLWETGVHEIPAQVGATAARWNLLFWDPVWVLGGLLFLLAARRAGRPSQDGSA